MQYKQQSAIKAIQEEDKTSATATATARTRSTDYNQPERLQGKNRLKIKQQYTQYQR